MGVRLEGVTKRFGHLVAVDRVDLEVRDGEFLTVVGPSGCGKTTLLRLIAGFAVPDEGRVWIGDRVVNDVPPRLRHVGIVFQNYALFPNMTVFDNVAFGLRARRVPPAEVKSRVGELLEMVGLADRASAYPRQLSGGQQQRTALARALAIRPRVLLLDEPLSALDAKVRLNLRYELRRIQREAGITTVYVTHDQEEALSISDRVAVMRAGSIRQLDTPEQVYRCPADRFVADFIGITNLLEVTVVAPGRVRWRSTVLSVSTEATARAVDQAPGSATGLVRAGAGRPPAAQGPLRLAIRPEELRLAAPATAGGGHEVEETGHPPAEGMAEGNRLKGVVQGRVFLGPTVRLAVEVDGERLLVDVPHGTQSPPAVGSVVELSFRPEAARLLSE